MAAFSAVIGEKKIVSEVKNKEEAKKEYTEAKKEGTEAIYAEGEKSEHSEWLNLKLGNLKPG